MNYKIITLSALFILTIIIVVSTVSQQKPSNTPVPQANSSHAFINFEPQSVISTVIINNKEALSYPKISIKKEQEDITDTASNIYSNSYQVAYKIEEDHKPTIDVLFEINKQKKNASVELKNILAKETIDITNGTQHLYKNVPTDWVGSVTIDNLNISNKICLTLNTKSNRSSQICHTIEGSSHA